MNLAACSATRAATRGAALPTETTAIPDPKSISELPSASTITPPPASVTNTGSDVADPAGHRALAPGQQLARDGSGDLGNKVPALQKAGVVARCMLGHDQTIDHQARRLKRWWPYARGRGRLWW